MPEEINRMVTETFSVNELAEKVKTDGQRTGYDVQVQEVENPRVEKEQHYYNPKYTGLLEMGFEPHYLTDEVLEGFFDVAERYKESINKDAIFRGVGWR